MEPEVTPRGAQPSQGADKGQGGEKGNEKIELTRQQFEALNRQLKETQESERFWAKQAQKQGGQPRVEEEEQEEVVETDDLLEGIPDGADSDELKSAIYNDPDKWAEAVSKGPQAVEKFIRAKGFLTRSEAAEMAADIAAKVARRTVDVERQKMGSDAAIMRDFPDLGNPQSDLFKETASQVKKLVAMDPRARNSPATLYAAAEAAKARLEVKAAGTRRRSPEREEDDDVYDRFGGESEEDRRSRAAAQDGSRQRGREADDREDMLGPEARLVMKEMGVSEADFLAESKALRGSRPRGRR